MVSDIQKVWLATFKSVLATFKSVVSDIQKVWLATFKKCGLQHSKSVVSDIEKVLLATFKSVVSDIQKFDLNSPKRNFK